MHWLAALAALSAAALSAAPPNVVLIISDDHGWGDYSFAGKQHVRTPNIDRLASEGLLITRGYVPTSLCRPSLASIMTGLYPHQHGLTGNDPPGPARDAENRARMTALFRRSTNLVSMLGTAGYVSHQSGKWWEGECTCCGFTQCMTHGDVARGGRHGDEGLKIGRETMQPVFDFIDQNKAKPFFLWYAPMMPHTPHNPPARLLERYRKAGLAEPMAKYYAMIEWFDETVGALRAHLEKAGVARNTIIAYVADNGWIQMNDGGGVDTSRSKLSPYDAGLRTPIILWGPGRVKSGRDDTNLASSVDLAPTLLKLAGVAASPAMQGIDLLDARARARRKSVPGAIFVHTSRELDRPEANLKYRWIVQGRYKLIDPYAPNASERIWDHVPQIAWETHKTELFDIVADPAEQHDLSASDPARVQALREELNRWWKLPQ